MIRTHDSLIVQIIGRVLIPLIQLFGIYVLCFGQFGPGGGFVGGVIVGTSLVFSMLVFGLDSAWQRIIFRVIQGDGVGLLVFAGVGGLCLLAGGEFLNYTELPIPGLDAASRRFVGIFMAQLGVAIDVAVTALSIVLHLADSSRGYGASS
ncbi:MAG: cation:proton antiporter [Nitrospirae bacterium]|nr:MAG: cation:proton antiporter [Nitrospirota bacterium]